MRKSGNLNSQRKGKDSNNSRSTGTYVTELDQIALSAKNTELTKENVKLKSANADLNSEVMRLKSQLFHIQRKEAELKQDIKSKAPYFALMVTSLMKYCESDVTASNRISLPSPSKESHSTQRVGPHMVNGIVLNVSPQVSLTRMNPVCSSAGLPSTSTNSMEHTHSESSNLSDDNTDSSGHNDDRFISRRSHRDESSSDNESHQDLSLENRENEDPSESEMLSSPSPRYNLSTISEESLHSRSSCHDAYFPTKTEMHITLTRMSIEDMRRNTFRRRDSSMDAVANDTCLSIETTVIEHQDFQDTGGSKKTENMILPPYFNSRQVVNANSTLKEIISTSACLSTPSMSALGDIDGNYSQLDILLDSGMTSTPAIAKSHPGEQSSPLSSKGNSSPMQSSTKLIIPGKRKRRIPVVVLEKLTDSSTQSQSGDKTQTELTENNSRDTISRSNSNLNPSENITKSKSKPTKKSIKRKLADDDDEESQAVPENGSQNGALSRPRRVAKPTVLKEISLKHKMRRT